MRMWQTVQSGLLVAAALMVTASLRAADSAEEIALQRALDAAVDSLELGNVELPKTFQEIAAKGKIKLQVDPTCYDLLPYGDTTKVSATFRQSKLRDAIDEILKPLGLEKTVSGDKVLITPTAPLVRVGRRATWDELRILAAARQESLPGLAGNDLAQSIRPILAMENLQVRIANGAGPKHDAAIEQVRRALPTDVWKALDIYSQATDQIWFVSDATIEIMPHRQWIGRQLERRVEIKKTNRPLVECVSELSHLSGIHFTPEPGLYSLFPQVTLNSTGGTVRDILDTLRGVIGIDYEVKDDSIVLKRVRSEAAAPAARVADPILGQMVVPLPDGGDLVMFIRESNVPPEVADIMRKRLQQQIEQIKKLKAANGSAGGPAAVPASATAPAPETNPATTTGASAPASQPATSPGEK